MKFLLFAWLAAIVVALVVAAPPCSTVNGKTYCTGLIAPTAAPAKNPCTTVNGKTYCTGLIFPKGNTY